MGNKASSSEKNLSEICQEIIEWNSRPYWTQEKADIPWTKPHLSALVDYVLKLEGISISQFTTRSNIAEDWHPKFEPQNHRKIAKMVATFTQDLRKLFEMPKLQQSSDKKNEVVAAFINFLLQLLYHRTGCMNSFADRIDSLEKDLRFLVTVLGDTPFLGTAELEQVHNLLAEFEAVANDAGSLVYHIVFLRVRLFKSVRIKKASDALLKRIDFLKVSIGQFLDQLPFISNAAMTPKTVSVNSLIIDSLLDDLENLMSQEGDLTVHVKDQIEILIQELTLSQSLFKAIKVPPHSEIKELDESVGQISDVAYEAEYLVNSFLAGDVPHWYLTTRLIHIIHKIKTLLQQLKTNYDIGALRVTQDFSAQLSLQPKKIFEVDDITVGFEENATYILDQLAGGTEHLQIISIIGMPGIGKTTFAKKIYNHPLVNYRFDRSSWCVVSQTYQRKRLLIDILLLSSKGDVNKNRIFEMEEENLIEHIYKSLKGRRYLVVMDDIWDSNLWIDLWKCFPDDENGSRILFTSRDKYVAPPNTKIYPLPFLSNDQCWELLKQKVFRDEPCPPQLLSIGKEIATNCHGLPLALVIIAGILSTMDNKKSAWKNVGDIFRRQGNSSEEVDEVWIAEGFIRKEEKKSADIVAEEYLMELIDKSLVMVVERRWDGGVKACVVHDLLLDLCLKISEEANFLKLVDE
ncbi:hypothetical protein DH2020_015738 [Rehmannia glutinosa]|uniref:NB-ARC domain-containing protein n=1 Tax=Rehmannia glutinosa TaxID=99300 RepID=A0ABR0WV27_REHGL